MGLDGFNAHTKHRILQHAMKGGNVSETCELFGISRTTFYNWNKAYLKYGVGGLENKERRKPQMPNRVSKSVEREILDYILKYPEDGPKRIYYELKAEGVSVGETGIFNVLKRHQLTKKKDRLDFAKRRRVHTSNRLREKKITSLIDTGKSYPGYLIVQKLDFIGDFEGIGKVYQYSFFDRDSQWAEVKIYNRKRDIDIWDFFESKLVYLLDIFTLTFENLVTEKERDFLPCFLGDDRYEEILESYKINNFFLPLEGETLEGILEFNHFLMKDFYSQLPQRKEINSFLQLEGELLKFVREYNFKKVLSEGENAGKTPAQVVMERSVENGADLRALPLWILALINAKRGEEDNDR